jgi:ureidoacrylate peracid hydrolase
LSTPENGQRRSNALIKGTAGHRIWKDLNVLDGEPVIEKTRFSAFVQGSSTLDAYLQEHGVDTLIIAGCLTDVCCESTARDAMMLNYRAIMVTDANAADHSAALTAFYSTFGDIMPTDMLIGLLTGR